MRDRNRPAGFLGRRTMQLSNRLQRIADYVRPGDRLADVGTDHAYIPIWLLLNKTIPSAIATDIRSGPLERAITDADRYGVSGKLKFIQCDGLSEIAPEEVDTVIVAGMGGETIIGILAAAPWIREKRLILQPQTKQAELRDWLGERGFAITDASLVYDSGRIYLVWLVEEGRMPPFPGVESALLMRRDALLKPYLEDQMKRLRKRLYGLTQAAAQDEALCEELSAELKRLEELYQEVSKWQA